jgi:hypothetical protein
LVQVQELVQVAEPESWERTQQEGLQVLAGVWWQFAVVLMLEAKVLVEVSLPLAEVLILEVKVLVFAQ